MITLNDIITSKVKGIIQQQNDKVIIKIPLKNDGFWEKEYNQNDTIQKMINEFKEENGEELPEEYPCKGDMHI